MNYQPVLFRSVDESGIDIYHTNVMMALGETFVVICMESIPDDKERERLKQCFTKTGKEIIAITFDQVKAFAGNMLQVCNDQDETILVMSAQAYHALTTEQVSKLEKHTSLLYSSIDTIETYGGGSARCMMAEVFLPEGGNNRFQNFPLA